MNIHLPDSPKLPVICVSSLEQAYASNSCSIPDLVSSSADEDEHDSDDAYFGHNQNHKKCIGGGPPPGKSRKKDKKTACSDAISGDTADAATGDAESLLNAAVETQEGKIDELDQLAATHDKHVRDTIEAHELKIQFQKNEKKIKAKEAKQRRDEKKLAAHMDEMARKRIEDERDLGIERCVAETDADFKKHEVDMALKRKIDDERLAKRDLARVKQQIKSDQNKVGLLNAVEPFHANKYQKDLLNLQFTDDEIALNQQAEADRIAKRNLAHENLNEQLNAGQLLLNQKLTEAAAEKKEQNKARLAKAVEEFHAKKKGK